MMIAKAKSNAPPHTRIRCERYVTDAMFHCWSLRLLVALREALGNKATTSCK